MFLELYHPYNGSEVPQGQNRQTVPEGQRHTNQSPDFLALEKASENGLFRGFFLKMTWEKSLVARGRKLGLTN